MNAFNEILAQLIEAVPSETWLKQTFFPFRELKAPRARLYDTCLFRQSASGALGFLWVQFDGRSEVVMIPFRLTRYSLEGEFISLPPWSLREATSDSELYEAWRMALHARNPMLTSAGGNLQRRFSTGEPSLLALGISSDVRNTCVRVDSLEAFKFFHILSTDHSDTLEVEVLQYLSEQNKFSSFPKLVSVHDYTMGELRNTPIAISMTYIQNSGTLWHEMTRLIAQARFPERTKEKMSRDAWYETLSRAEDCGRLIGEFHSAMAMARQNHNLIPESNSSEQRAAWQHALRERVTSFVKEVRTLENSFPNFSKLFHELDNHADRLLKEVQDIQNLGLRIRTHGHFHLGQMLVGNEHLYLLDFEADALDDVEYRKIKHSSIKDLTALTMSIRFAWYSVEKSESSPLLEAFLDKDSEFGKHVAKARSVFVQPKTYTPTLEEIENTVLKSYIQVLSEDASTRELLPENTMDFRSLFNFYFFMRALKEIVRDARVGNPRCKLSLKILQQFLTAKV